MPMRPRARRTAHGFTLIEVTAVVVIVGVLAALVFAGTKAIRDRADAEADESAVVGVIRQAQALALSRADGRITDADFERALANTQAASGATSTPPWQLAADPDPDVTADPPAEGRMRLGFTTGRRAAALAISVDDRRLVMGLVPTTGPLRVQVVTLEDLGGLTPTARDAAVHLGAGEQANVPYGHIDTPPEDSATVEEPNGVSTDLPASGGVGLVEHLGTAGGTAPFLPPTATGDLVVTTDTDTAVGDVLTDLDPATAVTVAGTPGSVTLDLTGRAAIVPTEAVVSGLPAGVQVSVSGSTDGSVLTRLDVTATTTDTDGTLHLQFAVDPSAPAAYRYLRVTRTDLDGDLTADGIDMHGTLYETASQPLRAVQDLTATVDAAGDVTLGWAAVPNASEYVITRDGTQVATVTVTSAVDSPAAGRHTYQVHATATGVVGPAATVDIDTADPLPAVAHAFVADDLALSDGAAVTDWTARAGTSLAGDGSARIDTDAAPGGTAAVVLHGGAPLDTDELEAIGTGTLLATVRWDGGRGGLLSRAGGLGWHVTSDGHVQVSVDGQVVATHADALVAGAWTHLAVQVDLDTVTTWAVGTRQAHSAAVPADATTGRLALGAAGTDRLDGAVAYVGLHPDPLGTAAVDDAVALLATRWPTGP